MAKKRRILSKKLYSQQSLLREREYGFYWYAWLWNLIRPVLIGLISLLICAGVLLSGWTMVYDKLFKPMDESDTSTVPFKIESGSSVSFIARNLEEQGFLRSKTLFKTYVQFQGLTSKIQSGEYQLSPSMTFTQIASVLSSGTSSQERTITIIPGWTVKDIAQYFLKVGAITDADAFLELCNQASVFQNDYTQLINAYSGGENTGRQYALEGYLAPDTYRVFSTASPESLLRTLLSQTEVVMDKLYAEGTSEEGSYVTTLSQDEVIILASIIEKEAATADDFGRVSAVLHNRLNAGMRLECDSTVNYLTGSSKLVLTNEELAIQSAYNTYVVDGLPVGPICNPSQAALKAALHPNEFYLKEGYLYFCSKDPASDELAFSKTLEEHQAAVAQYRPLWEAYDQQRAQQGAQ